MESNFASCSEALLLPSAIHNEEEEEALEDQRRRNKELANLCDAAFTDITNDTDDESDAESMLNSTHGDIYGYIIEPSDYIETIYCPVKHNTPLASDSSYSTSRTSSASHLVTDRGTAYDLIDSPTSSVSNNEYAENEVQSRGNEILSSATRPRRRYWSTQLSPLKEVEPHNQSVSECDDEKLFYYGQLREQYADMEVGAEAQQLALLYQARVRDVEQLTERVKQLEKELKDREVLSEKNNDNLSQMKITYDNNQKLLVEAQTKIKQMSEEIGSIKAEAERFSNEKNMLERDVQEARATVIDLENRIKEKQLNNHVGEVQELKLKHRIELQKFEILVEEKENKMKMLDNRIKEINKENEKLLEEKRQALSRLNASLQDLQMERAHTKNLTEQIERLSDVVVERDRLRERLDALQQQLAQLTLELSKLQQQNTPTDAAATVPNIESELKRSLDLLQQKRNEITELKSVIKEQGEMIESLTNKFNKMVLSVSCQTDSNQLQIDGYTRLSQDYKQLTADYIKRGEIIEGLRSELEHLQADFLHFQEEVNTIRSTETKSTNTERDLHLDQELARTQLEVESVRSECHQLHINLEEAQYEFNQLKAKFEATQEINTQLNEQVMTLKSNLEVRNKNFETMQSVIENLKKKLKDAKSSSEVSKLLNENAALRKNLQKANDNYEAVRTEIDLLRTNLELLKEERSISKESSLHMHNNSEELIKLKKKFESQLDAKYNDIKMLQAQIEQYRNSEDILRQSFEKQIETLRSSCQQKIALAKKECYQLLEKERISAKKCQDDESISSYSELQQVLTTTNDELESLQQCLQLKEQENKTISNELSRTKCELEKLKMRLIELENENSTVHKFKKQIEHLESFVQKHSNNLKSLVKQSTDVSIQVVTPEDTNDNRDIDKRLNSLQMQHAYELNALQNSFKTIMSREVRTIEAEYRSKLQSLELEKKQLEQCIQTLEQHSREVAQSLQNERSNVTALLESHAARLGEVTNRLAMLDEREANWRQREEMLEKERQTLKKGVDKFAKAMLELYIKHKHMRTELRRAREEKQNCFEYANTLKKKLTQQRKSRRRSLSENSTHRRQYKD